MSGSLSVELWERFRPEVVGERGSSSVIESIASVDDRRGSAVVYVGPGPPCLRWFSAD